MIQFFRKIRQRLIKENRISKYLLYAIGEIFLVVVGILIALQVNNWKQAKNNYSLAIQYRISLLRDMRLDLESVQIRIDNANVRIAGAERLIQLLEKGSEYGEYQKREDLIRAGWLNFFRPNLNTYNDLNNSGNIKLIKDDSLKLLLNEYVNHCIRIATYEEHDKINVWAQYGNYYRKWIDGRMNAAYLVQDSVKFLSYPVDWRKLEADSELRHKLTLVLETGYGEIARYDRVRQMIKIFIRYLEVN